MNIGEGLVTLAVFMLIINLLKRNNKLIDSYDPYNKKGRKPK